MATGPALCSPLNGVGLVVSKVQPFRLASFGSLNQKPTWKVLVGVKDASGSKPKIWSSRMVLIVALNCPRLLARKSLWYQASPKLVKLGFGFPFASRLLRCTVN